jgi:predicted nucleic acid-binding protein
LPDQEVKAKLSIKNMNFERTANVQQALELYLLGFDFADALHHCSAAGCTALATFDERFRKLAAKSNQMPRVIAPNMMKTAPRQAK